MAHADRVVTTITIPAHATRLGIKCVPHVRWKGRGGRAITARVCAKNPARCLLESRKWYAFYRDKGRLRKKPGYEDKAATEALAVELETRASRIAVGILPAEYANAAPLPARLDRWRDYLIHKGGTHKHADRQRARVELVFSIAEVERPADLTPVLILSALAELQSSPPTARGFGANSAAHYVGACKQFSRWLVLRDKSEAVDHLAGIVREYSDAAIRLKRRALEVKEFEWLLKATAAGPDIRRLTGTERSLLYELAASTGLRASELASLKPSSFVFGRAPTVTVQAAYAKNRRTDALSIPADLVNPLKKLVCNAGEYVWPARELKSERWSVNAAKMLAVDLTAAGISVIDERGEVFDFHALRVQFATDLDRAGVSLARAQQHMRHSTPTLTANLYTKHNAEDLADDVNKLRKRRKR